MPNWAILLVPPLLAIAWALSNGLTSRHPGHRVTARGRRKPDEEGSARAWLHRMRRDTDISPAAAAQINVHVMGALAASLRPIPPPSGWEPATGPIYPTAWQHVPAQDGPVPAALDGADSDPEHPYLDRPWADDTGTFTKIIEGE